MCAATDTLRKSTSPSYTGTADSEEVYVQLQDDSSSEFNEARTALERSVVENWIFLKENSNAFTWKTKFVEHKLLNETDIRAFGTHIKRSDLAEWLLITVLQKIERHQDIKNIRSVIFKDVLLEDRKTIKHASQRESTYNLEELQKILSNNRLRIEELLCREDAIMIKDHLIQNRIINLTENKNILTQEKEEPATKGNLISEVMELVICKFHRNSYQCFVQSLKTISNTTRRMKITHILKTKSMDEVVHSGTQHRRTGLFGRFKVLRTGKKQKTLIGRSKETEFSRTGEKESKFHDQYEGPPLDVQDLQSILHDKGLQPREIESIQSKFHDIDIGLQPRGIEIIQSKFHDIDIEGKQNFRMTIQAEHQTKQIERTIYSQLKKNKEIMDYACPSELGMFPRKISDGSLVIHLQTMERNMQDYIKDCLRKGRVTTVLQNLFSEISIEDVEGTSFGELLLKVKIEVNRDSDLSIPSTLPGNSLEKTNFVSDNQSFLVEEIDTDVMEEGLHKFTIRLPSKYPWKGRKVRVQQIIDFIIEKHLEEQFMRLIEKNEENRFCYVLDRLKRYKQVYRTESSCLRKNILVNFSQIVENIEIDDVRSVLLERNTVKEQLLNDIAERWSFVERMGMATLLLNILKSDNAVRSFVDALFIMSSYLAERMLRRECELITVETGSTVKICENCREDNLLFEGSFHIFIADMFYQRSNLSIQQTRYDSLRQLLIIDLMDFAIALLDLFEDARSVITTLKGLAEELETHFSRIKKTKIGGSAASIVGSVIGIVGLALTPFTFGASLGLAIAGGVVAGLGGTTVAGSLIADNVLSKSTKKKAETELERYSEANRKIKEKCLELSNLLKRFGSLEDTFPEWVLFWNRFAHGNNSNLQDFNWKDTQVLIRTSLNNVESAVKFVGEGVGASLRITGAAIRVAGTGLHVAGGIIGALMIPLDIYTIVDSAIDIHKNNKHEISKLIIDIYEAINNDLQTEDNIRTMIEYTINAMPV